VRLAAASSVAALAAWIALPPVHSASARSSWRERFAVAVLPPTPLAALAFGLSCAPALRDAGWVVGADLAAAVLVASIAVTRAERFEQLVIAPAALVTRFVDLPELAARIEVETGRLRHHEPVLRGALNGGLLVLPFAALFWTADAAFAGLGSSLPLPRLSMLPVRAAAAVSMLALCGGLALAARRPPETRLPDVRRASAAEWAIPLALLDLLFLAFVLVQITVLFGNHDHVLETRGLTYAEYARQGYAQLLAAVALTAVVLGVATRLAAEHHRRLLRILSAVLCLLTLVVLASALKRLGLYEDAYGFTRARLAAHAAGLWLGGLLALLLVVSHVRPRLVVGLAAAGLAAFTLANPDRLVARRNVDRWERTGRIDAAALSKLSADAAPELVRLPPRLRERALRRIRRRLRAAEPWSSANMARARARELLDKKPLGVG
jgi:hypothetical protein